MAVTNYDNYWFLEVEKSAIMTGVQLELAGPLKATCNFCLLYPSLSVINKLNHFTIKPISNHFQPL